MGLFLREGAVGSDTSPDRQAKVFIPPDLLRIASESKNDPAGKRIVVTVDSNNAVSIIKGEPPPDSVLGEIIIRPKSFEPKDLLPLVEGRICFLIVASPNEAVVVFPKSGRRVEAEKATVIERIRDCQSVYERTFALVTATGKKLNVCPPSPQQLMQLKLRAGTSLVGWCGFTGIIFYYPGETEPPVPPYMEVLNQAAKEEQERQRMKHLSFHPIPDPAGAVQALGSNPDWETIASNLDLSRDDLGTLPPRLLDEAFAIRYLADQIEDLVNFRNYSDYDAVMLAAIAVNAVCQPSEENEVLLTPCRVILEGKANEVSRHILAGFLLYHLGFEVVLFKSYSPDIRWFLGVSGADGLPGLYFPYLGHSWYYLHLGDKSKGQELVMGEIPESMIGQGSKPVATFS